MRHHGTDLENAENIFDGCTALLETLTGFEKEFESILLQWMDNVSLDYYTAHCDKFTTFLSFMWTVCHILIAHTERKSGISCPSFIMNVEKWITLENC